MRKLIITILTAIIFLPVYCQNLEYARMLVDSLTSPQMHGRGYVMNGDKIAAEFIENQFKENKLQPFSESYFQNFSIPINTFPDTIKVLIEGREVKPGIDYVLYSNSPSVTDSFQLIWFLMDSTGTPKLQGDYGMIDISDKVIVTDMNESEFINVDIPSKGVIFLKEKKVGWHVSKAYEVNNYFQMQILKDQMDLSDKWIYIHAVNHFYDAYPTQNVIAYVKGKKETEKFLVFTAHYDHLGRMGAETFFPGGNDNASGTAMILDLARHFSLPENQPDFNIAFMAFSAEEAGLCGSSFYTTHPLFPLQDILFLVNLDMVGSGSKGIKVVNGRIFENEFNKLVEINTKNEYILKVNARGEAANSDHYPFYLEGVPAFFIYTLGDECKEYHTIFDDASNVPFTEYEDVFRLLTDFTGTF